MSDEPESVGDVLGRLERLADGSNEVSVEKIVESFGTRGYGPFLLVPALLEISPIGGIPGVPTAIAIIVVLFATQILFGRSHLWLPSFVERRTISARNLQGAARRLRPVGRWMDRWFHNRLKVLTTRPFRMASAAACVALAATVPPLELIPFASTIPMAAVAAFGLALLVRDGLLMVVATLLAVSTVGVGVWLLLGGG